MHLQANQLVKRYNDFVAVDHVGFSLEAGEFLSLLGPSGCGKTTTLRMIAGFTIPDSGQIQLDGLDITHVPARRRNIGMVFQNYALFPHMSVADNVAFGLKMRRVSRQETARRVDRALELVRMEGYRRSRPGDLSGGQQQRVALARALVIEPTLLLLDEPLSALDLKLREELREEIDRITTELGITTVFVTHDQNEALVLSDKVAVMNAGKIEQIDTPENLYQRPATPFVARFMGGANVLDGVVAKDEEGMFLRLAGNAALRLEGLPAEPGARLTMALRPEAISPADGIDCPATLEGTVRRRRFLGSINEYVVSIGKGAQVTVRWPAAIALSVGDNVGLHVAPSALVPLERRENDADPDEGATP